MDPEHAEWALTRKGQYSPTLAAESLCHEHGACVLVPAPGKWPADELPSALLPSLFSLLATLGVMCLFLFVFFKSGSCFVPQAGLKLMAILLPQPCETTSDFLRKLFETSRTSRLIRAVSALAPVGPGSALRLKGLLGS